jgi:hypothetical protein
MDPDGVPAESELIVPLGVPALSADVVNEPLK